MTSQQPRAPARTDRVVRIVVLVLAVVLAASCTYRYRIAAPALKQTIGNGAPQPRVVARYGQERVGLRLRPGDEITLRDAQGRVLWAGPYRDLAAHPLDTRRIGKITLRKRNYKRTTWIAGLAGVALTYGTAAALSVHDRDYAIPVAGPFLVANHCDTGGLLKGVGCFFRGLFLYAHGFAQIGTLIVLAVGLSMEGPHEAAPAGRSGARPAPPRASPPGPTTIPAPAAGPGNKPGADAGAHGDPSVIGLRIEW